MKILNKLTVKSLKLNKKRTLVTIIGILLSTALITVVAGMVTSAQETLKQYAKNTSGDYHIEFKDVPINDLSQIEQNRNVESYFLSSDLGYAHLENSQNVDKPYVYIKAFDPAGFNKMPIDIDSGRLPENSNEIVISKSIIDNGLVDLKIGDRITLDVSKRMSDGYELNQDNPFTKNEHLEKKYEKKFTIVGIIDRLSYDIEPYSAPGYTVITYLDSENLGDKANIYVTYTKKALRKYNEVTANILGMDVEYQKEHGFPGITDLSFGTDKEEVGSKYNIMANESLLQYEGVGLNSSYVRTLYIIGAIVLFIIIISSVFVIRNSFAISITERTRQYGMLASIGATKKQIKKNVLFEGFILGIIAIPLGIILGILVNYILSIVLNNLIGKIMDDITFIYSLPALSIILAVILAAITIYFSCLSSARRASKVSPIDAIRSSDDIKIKGNKVKSPKIIKKIFGVGGEIAYKNLKRNKKKYRTTVISIIISIAIFISITSLVSDGFKVSNITYQGSKYNLMVHYKDATNNRDEGLIEFNKISKLDGIENYTITKILTASINKKDLKIRNDAKEYIESTGFSDSEEIITMPVYSLSNDVYKQYIKELGLNYDYSKDKIILVDGYERYIYNDDGSYKKQVGEIYDYKQGESLNIDLIGFKNENNSTTESVVEKNVQIAKLTDKKPMGQENTSTTFGFIVVSEDFINQYNWFLGSMYVDAKDAYELEKEIKENSTNVSTFNIQEEVERQNSLILIIAIFLYGFIIVISLIGITNIFNTITSNMNLRSKEFANLKSIGMTKKEFNRMIRLESIFYGTKAILIGVPLGILGSYAIYLAFVNSIEMQYTFPIIPTIIAIVTVFILIGGIMKYSLNKINKQNIIETIRKDNI